MIDITEEMVERMARSIHARSKEGRDGWTWPINGSWDRERDMAAARRTLVYVLGDAQ